MADHSERWLVCMRYALMTRVHPLQVNDRVCSRCGEQVGIYPSGQRALRADRGLKVVCNVCNDRAQGPYVAMPAPGALDEPRESVERT